MPGYTEHLPGTFCWAELVSADADAARTFYTGLFGWAFHDDPVGEGVYTMYLKDGKNVGAQYQRTPQQAEQGVPSHWGAYVTVADIEASVSRVKKHGGEVFMGPCDVMDIGRMAVCRDPSGAFFSIWQPLKHIGCQVKDEHGTMCWTELLTRDTAAAGPFYAAVFDWDLQEETIGGMDYTVFAKDGKPAAGMVLVQEMWGEIPPSWMIYFAVDDCDAIADRAGELGATVLCAPEDIQPGRFAVLQDPAGATFGIIQQNPPGRP